MLLCCRTGIRCKILLPVLCITWIYIICVLSMSSGFKLFTLLSFFGSQYNFKWNSGWCLTFCSQLIKEYGVICDQYITNTCIPKNKQSLSYICVPTSWSILCQCLRTIYLLTLSKYCLFKFLWLWFVHLC